MGVLVRLIRDLNHSLNLTSIVVSHDVHEVMSIADYMYIIADKRVIGHGTKEQLLESDSPLVQQFLRGQADGPVPFHFAADSLQQDLMQG